MEASALPLFFSHIEQQLNEVPNELRRIFHGRGKFWPGLDQLTCDWVDGQLLVNVFKEVDDEFLSSFKAGLVELTNKDIWQAKQGTSIVLQHRYADGAPSEVLWGELNDSPVVVEHGLKYQLDIGRNQNFGLFLDMRNGRQWVQDNAKDKNVLNLFAYTCGFSVAAIAGGARQCMNVDMSRGSLNKGRDNHRLNDHDMRSVNFLGYDIFKSWGKIKKGGPYELVIIDPPSFQKGSFALTKDYKKILRRLPELLTEGGEVIACVNSPAVSPNFLIETMVEEAPSVEFIERLDNPPEFVDVDLDSSLKVLRFKIGASADA
ncbi:23S rRNA (cytosine1962-C5)-methyltransferase [Vibrio crassostreae]|uniref:class I SAM-dependent methyltransferase n=1 Tax=Vibrio crassostreae TaxID=246167 RepID=UPI00070D9560|nr:class I SAM-dependent methyltransferase [Vibrio crassostreae]TCT61670.1 23S rRNA (cytosine1962-C5)-methyltransferase [Vibrio crassostreae]TCT77551.1 23S rRNA (cytosine1962-C5)-methyltransferase [Vibrio crassostreae]TCT83198.1 23S rRNA (cytosine1962-C5)-methyltransferase [Vibrio crassostreae]TCU03531.1 23S rRNA (cytosine1962-C5)-methyltransferase [Vibrio crassostreae]TDW08564.1 23S rRNA (cytosine1962-C5)-methyltransferase [Vibrio crassostreae]